MSTILKFRKYIFCSILFSLVSCDDFVEIEAPRTDLVRSTVFDGDETAEAAILDIYFALKTSGFASGSSSSISLLGSLSSDEMFFLGESSVQEYQEFNSNSIQSSNFLVASLWSNMYTIVYKANAIIEGLHASTELTENMKNQLTGEAKFIRAFCHFYLVNIWGDIPLALNTNYVINSKILRTAKEEVYQQMVADLKDAKALLSNDYAISNNERVRVNQGAAASLLARVYLYNGNWEGAEEEATSVINNVSLYGLEPDLSKVFRGTSREAIFQLWSDQFPNDRNTFFIYSSGPGFGSFRTEFVNDFETGDQRWVIWGQVRIVQGITYYGSRKYLDFSSPPLDYSTILRLAEQYLIRAEARVQLNKLSEARADINIIRNRAGLSDINLATQAELLNAILKERKLEFFAEWGHRWFDLKRTGKADAVLSIFKPDWNSEDILFPIPEIEN